ncbi:MAG: SURF1 family protein [Acidimicrobiales bacterium]|nr:SURF1 family protein [Acidimicrobiales bacterium]
MSRYRFALRPKWILSHLFVLALIVAMISAGFWQLRRLDQKKDRNRRIENRTAQPVVPVESLMYVGEPDAVGDLEYRQVEVRGQYLPGEQVLVRSRSLGGAPGSWVVAPLRLDDGTVVAVNRGWIPNSGQFDSVPASYAAPKGEVTVVGIVRKPETRGRFGPVDPPKGHLSNLARLDVARLDAQVPGTMLPGYVQLEAQRPAVTDADPKPVPREALDEGPHLNYAVQWFTFTTIAIIGYPLILRRRARELEEEARIAERDAADGPGDDEDEHTTSKDPASA